MSVGRQPRGGVLALIMGDPAADRAVPPSGVTGHLSTFATAAMALLIVFSLSLSLAAGRVAERWSGVLSGTGTVEIDATGDDAELMAERVLQILGSTEGVASARRLVSGEIDALLAPWLGDGGLAGLELPVLVAVQEGEGFDADNLRLRLEGEVPGASYARHAQWREALVGNAARLRLIGALFLALSFAVTATVITLAARASLAMNIGVIETLRLIGARDTYIARAFVRRFTLRGFTGAAIGTGLGVALLFAIPDTGPGGLAALRPAGAGGWALLALIPLLSAVTAFVATRRAAFRALARIR